MPGEPGKIEISGDAELSRENDQQMRDAIEQIVDVETRDRPQQQERIRENRRAVGDLLIIVEETGHANAFSDPMNPAQSANEAAAGIERGGEAKVINRAERVGEGLSEADKMALLVQLASEDKAAADAMRRNAQPPSRSRRLRWLKALGGLLLGGLIVGLYFGLRQDNSTEHGSKTTPDVDERDLEANQTFLSLAMQAAANNPADALSFGVTTAIFGQLRQAILADRDTVSEDQYWSMQADKSTILFPPTQKPFTLGDHLLALDFQFELLSPLYDSQPLDLDVNETISALADVIDSSSECPMQELYSRVTEFVPEASGANRLQRIVLVRSALARAIARVS